MHSCSIFTLPVLSFAAPISARPRTPQNQWAPTPLGFRACLGMRESTQPLTRCAAIIIIAACVEAPIIPCLVCRDLIVNTRALASADRGPQQLALRLAKKHGASNRLCVGDKLYLELRGSSPLRGTLILLLGVSLRPGCLSPFGVKF